MNVPDNTAKDFWIEHAYREIMATYGHRAVVKPKSLLKFGTSSTIGTAAPELVWNQGGTETYVSTNSITHIASSSASDTGEVKVEGHTISGGELTFVVQSVILAGQTKTALTTPLARTSRCYNNTGTSFVGDVYIAEDVTFTTGVPQTAAAIHVKIAAGENQSAKAATSFSKDDYYMMTNFYAEVGRKTVATVNFYLEVREKGKVFRRRLIMSADSRGGMIDYDFRPFLIITPSSDIRIMARSSAATTGVSAGFNGLLCLK